PRRPQPTPASPKQKPLSSQTVAELVSAAANEKGPQLKSILVELEKRRGEPVLSTLGIAAASYEADVQQLARQLLVRHLGRQTAAELKVQLKNDQAEVRAAAARLVGSKGLRFGSELIDLLGDAETVVRQAARQALVQLARGTDFGPEANASDTERAEAVRQWRDWWDRQGGK